MRTLVIATRNAHKVQEIRAVLGEGFRYLTLREFPNAPAVVEDAPTFAGNAATKATALAAWLAIQPSLSGAEALCVLADDSGLEVDALGGAPGVHSARFAARDRGQSGNSTDAENNAKLLRLLEAVPQEQRTARFRCAIAVARVSDAEPPAQGTIVTGAGASRAHVFEGSCEGRILRAPRGSSGFGYDPLFQPDGHEQTLGELGEAVKNRISHRARALTKLREWFADCPG